MICFNLIDAIGNGNSFSTLDAIQTDSNGAYSTTFASPIDSVGGRVVATMIDCDNRTSVKTESFGHANNVTTIEIDFNYCQRISNNSCQVSIRRIGSFLAAKPSGREKDLIVNYGVLEPLHQSSDLTVLRQIIV